MRQPPSGTVTFLFTDIEGSTRRWEDDAGAMSVALQRHDSIMRAAIEANGGWVFKTVGDAFCAVFATAPDAVAAALAAQRALLQEDWEKAGGSGPLRVRMALHTGAAEEREDDYYGPPVNRVARLLAAGHGAQTLVSLAAQELARDGLPPGVQLRDLGEHRLKDLFRPEHVFQVVAADLPADFPPLRTLDARPHNLPVQPTPLVGREREVAAVREMMGRDEVRLVTLLGPGGTGKTRLGLQLGAEMLDDFADGVFFVPLAGVSDAGLVAAALAQTLGVREGAHRSRAQSVQEHLKSRQMLLVLDNFEQVVDAAPFVAELLAGCPRVKILVTSRTVLRVRGEHEYAVPPLALPPLASSAPGRAQSPAAMSQFAAVQLFIERAQAVKSSFAVTNENAPAIAELCHRLDGLPLAIELAASRVKLLPPQAILTRLVDAAGRLSFSVLAGGARDLPARQQTLRSTIAWSYDLLEESEKTLFRRLAAFTAGCTLEAADAVCAGSISDEAAPPGSDEPPDVLEGVASLLDKSLLRQTEEAGDGEPRVFMLETIREFGVEQLEASGEARAVRKRHADYFLALAEEGVYHLFGSEPAAWNDRLQTEQDNLRAALAWMLAHDADMALRMGVALHWFWAGTGRWTEDHEALERALAAGRDAPRALRIRALDCAAHAAGSRGDYDRAVECARGFLELSREAGSAVDVGWALNRLGDTLRRRGEFAAARVALEECRAVFRELKHPNGLAWSGLILGAVAREAGDLPAAHACLTESLAMHRQCGQQAGAVETMSLLASVLHEQGEVGAARALFDEALPMMQGDEMRSILAWCLHHYATLHISVNEPDAARARLRDSLRIFHDTGEAPGTLRTLLAFARLAAREGQWQRAARLLGAEAGQRAARREPLSQQWAQRLESLGENGRAALGAEAFTAAWMQGRAMSLEHAVEYMMSGVADN